MLDYIAYLQNKKWLQEMKAAKNKNKHEFQEELEKLLKQKKERE